MGYVPVFVARIGRVSLGLFWRENSSRQTDSTKMVTNRMSGSVNPPLLTYPAGTGVPGTEQLTR
jgi:hypothetical protein